MRTGINYYFSGVFPAHKEAEYLEIILRPTHRLLSCHEEYYKMALHALDLISTNVPKHTEIILDSGAFTAWTKEKEVNISDLIDTYSSLIEKYESSMKNIWLINLDRIPGSVKRAPSAKELEAAKIESMRNFNILEKVFGTRVLPVFHQGESWDFLKDVAQASEYICVSPQNNVNEMYRVQWSKEVHKRIPNTRTHGLATTGSKMITQVPWYSVDSASWIRQAATGKVIFNNNGFLKTVVFSEKSPTLKKGGHYKHLPKSIRDSIEKKLTCYNISTDSLLDSVYARMAVTVGEVFAWSQSVERDTTATRSILFAKPRKVARVLLER